jgi:trehalose-phosphatase
MKILNEHFDINAFLETKIDNSLLILDYDGTLAPYVTERKHAHTYPGVKERLKALLAINNSRIVIVSGRSLGDLEHLLGKSFNLEMWGSHGLERKLITGEKINVDTASHVKQGLLKGLELCQEGLESIYYETKPYSVAIHWRGIENPITLKKMNEIKEQWDQLGILYNLDVHLFDGGVELRPKGHTKGDVVKKLLTEISDNTVVAYLGDDNTDEEAFKILGNRGLKVLVRKENRVTLADIQLIPPEELLMFLDDWMAMHE